LACPLTASRRFVHDAAWPLSVSVLWVFSWQRDEPDETGQGGLDALRPDAYVVNGRVTQHNPWAVSGQDAMWKYRELQAKKRAAAAAAAEGSSGSS
jgi:hypothetical protein